MASATASNARALLAALALLAGCGDDGAGGAPPASDAGEGEDASTPRDAGDTPPRDAATDGGSADAQPDDRDAADEDSGAIDASADDSGPDGPDHPEPATAAELAVRSAASYDDNTSGVITPARLLAWLEDWARRRPAGIEGDLVIAQLSAAPEPGFVRGRPGVRVYAADDLTALLEPRSNGIAALGTVPANGIRIDNWLRKYGIRPDHDLVVLAAGEPAAAALEDLARAWLALRYWGFGHHALALLNGSVAASIPEAERSATGGEPGYAGDVRIPSLENDHFVLLADVGEVRDAIGRDPILDVRSAEEHAGTALAASPSETTCLAGAPLCKATFSGRIAGAIHVPWSSFVDPATTTLRSRAAIEAALSAAGVAADRTAIVYDGDRSGSATATFALLAIAGVPARWYAASFLEWGTLNAAHPSEALRVLPETSPWRTDVFPSLTEGATAWSDDASAARPLVLDPSAASSRRVQQMDLQYKRIPPFLPPVGSGGNDCL